MSLDYGLPQTADKQCAQVAIHHDKWDEWTTCLIIEGLELPSNPFLGFSAHTGDVSGTYLVALNVTSFNT